MTNVRMYGMVQWYSIYTSMHLIIIAPHSSPIVFSESTSFPGSSVRSLCLCPGTQETR